MTLRFLRTRLLGATLSTGTTVEVNGRGTPGSKLADSIVVLR